MQTFLQAAIHFVCAFGVIVSIMGSALSTETQQPVAATVIQWNEVQLSLQTPGDRQSEQKQKLLASMERSNGQWTPNHPRYRLLDALHGFDKYYERQRAEVDRFKSLYKSVTKTQKNFLESHVSYSAKFKTIEQRIARNQHVCDDIVNSALAFYSLDRAELQRHIREREDQGHLGERVSVSQALKHIVRDWTEEGAVERKATFACITKTLQSLFPAREHGDEPLQVLVPGSGLGRLGHEIRRLGGFSVTMNEWSMYMNVIYRFLKSVEASSQAVHPFIDGWSHHATDSNMNRAVSFPDSPLLTDDVLLVEGDFTTAFAHQHGHYDIIVTYFFIDTARNLMSYFDTINLLLRQGGMWINLGPLLYGTGPFVQLSLDDIITVTEAMGFRFLETDDSCGPLTFPDHTIRNMKAAYTFDNMALVENAYKAQFWVAQKE